MTGQCEKAEAQLRRAFEIRRQVHQQMDSAPGRGTGNHPDSAKSGPD